MKKYDRYDDIEYFECDNGYNGCGDQIWEVGNKELCTDCAFEVVFDSDKGEKFLFRGDTKNDMAVLSYFFTDEEIVEILRREAEKLKADVSGYIKYGECLKECIEENCEKSEFLRKNGYTCVQEGWD